MKKILLGLGAAGITLAMIPLFAAFEAHVVNVTATIENALSVPTTPITFGTVFPQEHLNKTLDVALSTSFRSENRVDDVSYIIRQKPKCAWSWWSNGVNYIDETSTQTGHVTVNPDTGVVTVDCGSPVQPANVPPTATWGELPSLCPYISKEGPDANDGTLASFHQPYTVVQDTGTQKYSLVWTDTRGYLSKLAEDFDDRWIIDLAVPCFGGFCAQDWANFVHGINPQADPAQYTQPIDNEHKVFGCNLWIEVEGVSETPIIED